MSPHDSTTTAAREGWEDGDGEAGKGTGYPPGEHPLEGVPGLEDLAEPEVLSSKVDLSEVSNFLFLDTFKGVGWVRPCVEALAKRLALVSSNLGQRWVYSK